MNEFDVKTSEAIGYYVYCLVDPISKKPFYIGKGKGNRIFSHATAAITDPSESDKLEVIRSVLEKGLEVEHIILRHGVTEETALAIETALIDFSSHFELNLANIVLGHKSSAFGLMSVDEIQRKYTAKPLTELADGCVIININNGYKKAKGSKDFYQVTKESWVISDKRIPTLKYVLSEYSGFIVEIFEVGVNGWYEIIDHNGRKRWGFDGVVAREEIRSRYLNRSIKKKKGAANPITYKLS